MYFTHGYLYSLLILIFHIFSYLHTFIDSYKKKNTCTMFSTIHILRSKIYSLNSSIQLSVR